jgi:hypothetical protein
MTAVKGIGGKWIAVNPLDTIVFGMTQHKTVLQSKMTRFVCGWLMILGLGVPVEPFKLHLKHHFHFLGSGTG